MNNYKIMIGLCICAALPFGLHAENNDSSAIENRIIMASPYSIQVDETLSKFVKQRAQTAIKEHCASCHGSDLTGKAGVPNLVDFDWLWGITFEELNDVGPVMELEQTILYGVRNTDCPDIEDISYYGACADTRFSQMPAYGELGSFNEQQIKDLTEYVLSISGNDANAEAATRGKESWPVCTECHGPEGMGYKPYGGPDLTDDVWLFGGDRATIIDVIDKGRTETCPAWGKTLDAATIKSLAVYIWFMANGRYEEENSEDTEELFDFNN